MESKTSDFKVISVIEDVDEHVQTLWNPPPFLSSEIYMSAEMSAGYKIDWMTSLFIVWELKPWATKMQYFTGGNK